MSERICIVGGGIAGLGAAWALHQHPDRFDFQIWERNDRRGGNAMTVDIPQDDGSTVPIDISVTAFIPSVYQNYVELLNRYDIAHAPTQFSYTCHYGNGVYAHDYDSDLRRALEPEIRRLQ